ncbi:amino acid adenylation domain-containing protein [Algoriphagus namhaensis]|uniref:Amino acid adenylation domain-containing protein n=1 Tax=Algoriphagus namhaensis TaxID=915353 RepID=A0ABV8AWL1_9BACT
MQSSQQAQSTLTGSQQSIWASQKFAPESTANHLPHTFELEGKIDPSAFKKAFKGLIATNDSLRTVFHESEDHEVLQLVLEEFDYDLEFLQINPSEIKDWINDRIQKPIDLHNCTFDSVLIQLEDERFIWYLNIHHILADATTFKVLFEEMAKLYFAILDQKETELAEKGTFSEFRAVELSKRNEQNIKSENYWKKKGQNPVKQPLLYGNPIDSSINSAKRIRLPFNEELKALIQEKSNAEGYRSFNLELTKFTIWATLFAGFVSRISGESIIRLGSPFPNRNLAKFKNTSGLLMEVLPFDIQIDSTDSFASLFKKVRQELFDFFKNGHPGAQTLENSRGIHLIINYIPLYFGDFGNIPTRTKWLFPDQLDAGHEIRFQAFDFNQKDNLDFYFDINERYLGSGQIERLPLHFKNLVQACLTDESTLITDIKLATPSEESVLIETEKTGISLSKSLDEQLANSFEQNSNEIALVENGKRLNYGELNLLVRKAIDHLSSKGIKQGDIVAIHKPRSMDYMVSVLACLRMGAAFVSLPIDLPKKRIELILEDLEPKILISRRTDISGQTPCLDLQIQELNQIPSPSARRNITLDPERLAYILFTSGSTGKPKGVEIELPSLSNYISEAKKMYSTGKPVSMPLFTSVGFDLTITSIFLPLVSGGSLHIYPESGSGPDLSILEVIKNDQINTIKLTPSHARLIKDRDLQSSKLKVAILGGENLESKLAKELQTSLGSNASIFNEYGPTEATVGCIVHRFDPKSTLLNVPIGQAISGCSYYILDGKLNPVPQGVSAMLYLGGAVLAKGYFKNPERTDQSFIPNPFDPGQIIYKTGDLARLASNGDLEFLGRQDEQIKLNGVRIESSELESLIAGFPGIEEAHIALADANEDLFEAPDFYCKNCGLPSNYPDATFDEEQVCSLCKSFEDYQRNVSSYFKSIDNLRSEILGLGEGREAQYDCMMLLSGGKDSSYALARLVELDMKVLAFTLDNGFISDHAKQNIDNTTQQLGVDHIYGTTEAMNAIFRDSIERHQNVCNGCFKTVYTLSTKLALDKNIPVIVTGLSRGQFFETRLTEELFVKENFDPSDIDNIILEARKSYHRSKDAVSEYLDVSMFETDEVFEKVSFVDFYRFSDVSLSEMYAYLDEKIGWKRPTDTGRSTNCIINDLGIFVHKKKKGYHNYAFPYSWDVRVGHKKREETIDELNDQLSPDEIKQLMIDIGLEDQENTKEIRAYFKANSRIDKNQLLEYLREHLPQNMIPSNFIQVDAFPLTSNGKVDKASLIRRTPNKGEAVNKELTPPQNKIEQLVHDTWCSVLKIEAIDVTDSFIPLGGNSLSAIRIVSLLSNKLNFQIGVQVFFEKDSIRELSKYIASEIKKRMGIK